MMVSTWLYLTVQNVCTKNFEKVEKIMNIQEYPNEFETIKWLQNWMRMKLQMK